VVAWSAKSFFLYLRRKTQDVSASNTSRLLIKHYLAIIFWNLGFILVLKVNFKGFILHWIESAALRCLLQEFLVLLHDSLVGWGLGTSEDRVRLDP